MRLEEHAVTSQASQLMLVALLVTLAGTDRGDREGPEGQSAAAGSLAERLRRLSLAEIQSLAQAANLQIAVRFDADRLLWGVHTSERRREERMLLEYFVRHRAPRALLRRLFKVSKQRIEALRRTLNLAPSQGRPRMPRGSARDEIVEAWRRITASNADLRVGYRRLHESFPRYSIATLDAVIREVDPGVTGAGSASSAAREAHASSSAAGSGRVEV
jgi:hypothetical protein